ncbi:MAG: hypothetical protein Athens071425_398 [Parcubacteria group bacterium Athens0714_25]|nr:MAG: hypothetical protein Athens071425_398 [Parcubacteria group bacterium Athens0714_25]
MKTCTRILLIIAVCFIFSGCASKSTLYEPCEGEIGEDEDGAAIGRVALFSVIVNGEKATLRNYAPETLGDLRPGEEVFFTDINGKKIIQAIFTGYEKIIIDGVSEISIPEEE